MQADLMTRLVFDFLGTQKGKATCECLPTLGTCADATSSIWKLCDWTKFTILFIYLFHKTLYMRESNPPLSPALVRPTSSFTLKSCNSFDVCGWKWGHITRILCTVHDVVQVGIESVSQSDALSRPIISDSKAILVLRLSCGMIISLSARLGSKILSVAYAILPSQELVAYLNFEAQLQDQGW